jgi:hypothetical protein
MTYISDEADLQRIDEQHEKEEKEHNITTIQKDSDSYLSKDMIKIEDVNKMIDKRLLKLQVRIKYDELDDLITFARKDELEEFKQSLKELGEKQYKQNGKKEHFSCKICSELANKKNKDGTINKYLFQSMLWFDSEEEIIEHIRKVHPKIYNQVKKEETISPPKAKAMGIRNEETI